jgi:hypothetical protein
MPVQNNKFLPVFCFYASLPRTSLLQGNASTGARGPKQHFIFRAAGCTDPLFLNPIERNSPERSEEYKRKRGWQSPRTTGHSFPNSINSNYVSISVGETPTDRTNLRLARTAAAWLNNIRWDTCYINDDQITRYFVFLPYINNSFVAYAHICAIKFKKTIKRYEFNRCTKLALCR